MEKNHACQWARKPLRKSAVSAWIFLKATAAPDHLGGDDPAIIPVPQPVSLAARLTFDAIDVLESKDKCANGKVGLS